MPSLNDALAEMRADPESFLRHYLVTIAGGASRAGTVPQQQASFRMEPGGQPYTGFQTGTSGRRGLTKERPHLRITKDGSAATANAITFQAWYIPMASMGDDRIARHVVLSGNGGPDIALTSQMSGCTLGIGSATPDGSRLVAHIQPPPGQPNAGTYRAMQDAASLGRMDALFDRPSHPGSRSYGNPENRATIIGVRRAGEWRFYAQIYNHLDRTLFAVERL